MGKKSIFVLKQGLKTTKNAIFGLKKKTGFLDGNYTFFHVSGHSGASISFQREPATSKRWKDSLITYGSIIVLLILIPIVLNSSLEEKLNNNIQSQLELEIGNINCKSFVNYTGKYTLKKILVQLQT